MKIILDTSFLLRALEEGLDTLTLIDEVLESTARKATLKGVIEELKAVAGKGGARAKHALLALRIVEGLEVIHGMGGPVDEDILNVATEGGFVVATADSELRRRLRSFGVSVVYIKDGYLGLDGPIPY